MKFNRDYYYINIKDGYPMLNDKQMDKFKLIENNQLYYNISENADYEYLILNKTDLLGFFSLNQKDEYIKISSLYICKEYRNRNIATEIINDVIFAVKYNFHYDVNCIVVNSYVESALFFLKRGFSFCKINKKLDYKKKNIILMHKTF